MIYSLYTLSSIEYSHILHSKQYSLPLDLAIFEFFLVFVSNYFSFVGIA